MPLSAGSSHGPPDEPRFLWVHYYDPHNPLQPPRQHLDEVAPRDAGELRELADFLEREHRSDLQSGQRLLKIIRYDAEIRFVDAQIERLFRAVQARDPESNTLWVITSDHGQGLANHGWFGHHYYIYNELVHVPLILHFSKGAAAGRVIEDQLVELVDLPVTILDLLGETMAGQVKPIQGRSLRPLLSGDRGYRHRLFALSERRRGSQPVGEPQREPGERYSLQSLESKYIWFTEGLDEYYDLVHDPYETQNLIDRPIEEKEALYDTLRSMVERLRSEESPQTVDEETLQRLRSLGYVR